MSIKKLDTASPFSTTNVPLFFVDQPAELALGAMVTKITFGVSENDDTDFPRPVVTIAIPTLALIDLVNDLKQSFSDPNFRNYSLETFNKVAKLLTPDGKHPSDTPKTASNSTPKKVSTGLKK